MKTLLIAAIILSNTLLTAQTEEDGSKKTAVEPPIDEPLETEPLLNEGSDSEEAVIIRTEIPKQIQLTSPSQNLKILSPWAPKPLQAPPNGWRYVAGSPDQAYIRKIQLKSGNKLELKITPYIIVPEDSPLIVQVLEPGYIPAHGYRQKSSVTASLSTSNYMLKQASENLDDSIDSLKSLLETLPKPEPAPKP